jgi:hypothetical protein
MATPQERLAQSLEVLSALQEQGKVAIKSKELPRLHRTRLLKSGFLQEVMKGWYIPTRPDEAAGDSTAWYASFWDFCATYLNERFGTEWSVSPEQSLSLHVGNRTVPKQLIVRAPKASKNITQLLHGTSLMDVVASVPAPVDAAVVEGVRVFSLPAALVAASPAYFTGQATDARAALAMIRDASEVLPFLLEKGHSIVAGRLAGAFRNIGRERAADDILAAMRAAGYDVRESDPFDGTLAITFGQREVSPHANRIRLLWQTMRQPVLDVFPAPPGLPRDKEAYLKRVEEVYVTDAYHSLSIEGYRVSRELIERVRTGIWNPEGNKEDDAHRDALAARGYWQASQAVRGSLKRILSGENAGTVADDEHGAWYREMFGPSVVAGIIKARDLAGYRDSQVYIRRSMHVPLSRDAVRDAMPVFFDLLREETEPAVRVVLGHFIFVYIHPYMDGNGRMARFLMNTMNASGGYPWTVIPVERRADYMAALEAASARQNIAPFANFLGELVDKNMQGKPAAKEPK